MIARLDLNTTTLTSFELSCKEVANIMLSAHSCRFLGRKSKEHHIHYRNEGSRV